MLYYGINIGYSYYKSVIFTFLCSITSTLWPLFLYMICWSYYPAYAPWYLPRPPLFSLDLWFNGSMVILPYIAFWIFLLLHSYASKASCIFLLSIKLYLWLEGTFSVATYCITYQWSCIHTHIILRSCFTYTIPLCSILLAFYILVGGFLVDPSHIPDVA